MASFNSVVRNQLVRWGPKMLGYRFTYRLARWLLALSRALEPRGSSRAAGWLTAQAMLDLALDQAEAAYAQGKAIWTTAFFPTELVYAFDFMPLPIEVVAAVIASMGLAPQMLNQADREWYSHDLCSFHRCAYGCARLGYLPRPRAMLSSSAICDGGPKLFRNLEHLEQEGMAASTSAPAHFLLDVPVLTGTDDLTSAVAYVADQLKEASAFLEELAGHRLSLEKLKQSLWLSNQARQWAVSANQLRQRYPGAISGQVTLNLLAVVFGGFGSDRARKVYQTLYQEIASSSPRPTRESELSRLLWLHVPPYYPHDIITSLEKELGAVIAFEELNDVYWPPLDLERPWESLAHKVLAHPSYGPPARRLEHILRLAEDYHVDGVIQYSNWGCHQAGGSALMIQQALREQGLPMLVIDGDCVDPRDQSPEQVRTRLESFMEVLKGRQQSEVSSRH